LKSIVYLGCPASERVETEQTLAAAGVSVVWADHVAHALSELQRHDMPVVLDLTSGEAALQHARELKSRRGAALMFAVVDERRPDLTTEAVLAGFADVFARPVGGRRLASAIQRELRHNSQPHGTASSLDEEELYGHSRGMRDVKALISRAAANRTGVLICGEPGTGRRLVAKNIHAHTPSAMPFVTVDCVADDPEHVEHQLFGDVARPLNGESERRTLERVTRDSRLVAAAGGTLYLRNVADMPARLQARIARVLRDREATIAGVGQTVEIDIRPIASIDSGMERAVSEGRLRDDLVRRLSTMRIDVPPLRDRREDIPALANYFIREICAERQVPSKTLSRPALSLIAALPWRGNAAELRTLLENIVARSAGRAIAIEDVLGKIQLDGGSVVCGSSGTLRQARARFEREYIASVLDQHHGRIGEAAMALGIQRTNLYRKMRALRVVSKKTHGS
jgi:DNA-binding NtrC family response regulator